MQAWRRSAPTKAAVRAEGDKLVGEKMRRIQEIQALKKEHGAAWVFVPTAEERAAAAVPAIEEEQVPDLVRSMFEQLKIKPEHHTASDTDGSDHEIWEDLSQIENASPRNAPTPAPPAPKPKPSKPKQKGDAEIWEDFSQMDDS